MMILHAVVAPVALLLLGIATPFVSHAASTSNGEEARWLVQSSKWATLSWIEKKDLDDSKEVGGDLKSLVVSIAESDGRIFFYLTQEVMFRASITLSEAQVDPAQFFGARCGPDGELDPQDPRCAKLTVSGVVSPVAEGSKEVALGALFAKHPQMKDWPEDHGFNACEMTIDDEDGLWMIANFGGGGFMDAADYHDSEAKQHAVKGFGGGVRALEDSGACYNPSSHECECIAEKCGDALCHAAGGMWTGECGTACECEPSETALASLGSGAAGGGDGAEHGDHGDHGDHGGGGEHGGHGGGGEHGGHGGGGEHGGHGDHGNDGGSVGAPEAVELPMLPRPDFNGDAAGHARWIVAKSLWTTVSTVSSTKEGETFGNIRSVADGNCLMGSTGLPVFYLPAPDPTNIDIQADARIALSFTEAVLAERVGDDGVPCGGKDAEDPTCGKLTLSGKARALDDDEAKLAQGAFGAQHPRAEWLASGGSHTGGGYYTLDLHEITFLENYGGYTIVTPDEYLGWKPDPSKLAGEPRCDLSHGGDSAGATSSQSAVSTSSSSSSSMSMSAGLVLVVIVASFFGSMLGGVVSDKLKRAWSGGRGGGKRTGYAEASSVENGALDIHEAKAGETSKEWV